MKAPPIEEDETARALARAIAGLVDGCNCEVVVRALVAVLSNAVCTTAKNAEELLQTKIYIMDLIHNQVVQDYPVISRMKREGLTNSMILPKTMM